MKKLNNFITKLVDTKTQKLLKVGYLNGDLEMTTEGKNALLEVLFFTNIDALITKADEVIAEEEKNSKN